MSLQLVILSSLLCCSPWCQLSHSLSLHLQLLLSLVSWPSLFSPLLRHFLNPESYIPIVSAYCLLSVHLSATYPAIVFTLSLIVPFKLHKRDGNLIGSVSLIHFKATPLVKVLSTGLCTLCWPGSMRVPLCLAQTLGPIICGERSEATCIRNPCEGMQEGWVPWPLQGIPSKHTDNLEYPLLAFFTSPFVVHLVHP